MNRRSRQKRGFTLVEILAALLILSLIVTAALTLVGFDKARRVAMTQGGAVWWAIEQEFEVVRTQPYEWLEPGEPRPFLSNPAFGLEIEAPVARLTVVEGPEEAMRTVTAEVSWGPPNKRRRVEETIWIAAALAPDFGE